MFLFFSWKFIKELVYNGGRCERLRRKDLIPIYDQVFRGRRRRHNQELMEIFNRPIVVNEIKRSKWEWAGHVCRKQQSMVRRVLQENPREKRPLSRPREDGIETDFLNAEGVTYGGMVG